MTVFGDLHTNEQPIKNAQRVPVQEDGASDTFIFRVIF
jgi:hypothetical protein